MFSEMNTETRLFLWSLWEEKVSLINQVLANHTETSVLKNYHLTVLEVRSLKWVLKKAKIKSWWLQGWNLRVHSRRRESLSLLLPNLLKTTHTLVHGPFLESRLHISYSDSNLLWLWSSPLTPYLHCLLFMYSWNVFVFYIFLICFTRYILRLFLPQYLTCLFNILMMPFINVNLKFY